MRILSAMVIFMIFISNDVAAAHFRDGGFLADKGILESIRLEPGLPAAGESFTLNLTGSWPPVNPDTACRAPLVISDVVVYETGLVAIISLPQEDPSYCDQPPASWDLDVTIPATAWDIVDENGFLHVEHQLFTGVNMFTHIYQAFDMRLGTHEVPAYIGSGFWISADLPFEGILTEQQGSRVLFYGLRYDRDVTLDDDGEPVWQLVAGEMYGDSTLGRSYRYDWQFDGNNMPVQSPTEAELLTANDSGAIIVNDFNHIRVFTEVDDNHGLYHDYTRIAFGIDKSRVPNYVPPLDGRWTLYGFEGQDAVVTASLEFLEGRSPALNQYNFDSASGDWLATCTVVPPGTGACNIERVSDGTKFEFPITAFQGNLALGNLATDDNSALDGVLVRDPWKLPVVDNQ